MMDPFDFARIQMELTSEFARYVVDNPEADAILPALSYIYFEVADEPEFNGYSRALAEKQLREEGLPLVCVRIKGLKPRQGSRLIDPIIEPIPA
jgi:hypothetical protein